MAVKAPGILVMLQPRKRSRAGNRGGRRRFSATVSAAGEDISPKTSSVPLPPSERLLQPPAIRHSSFVNGYLGFRPQLFPWPLPAVPCTLWECSPPAKSSVPAGGLPPGCPTTSTGASSLPWRRPSIGPSARGITSWSRPAPASARASPTSCPPSWPPAGSSGSRRSGGRQTTLLRKIRESSATRGQSHFCCTEIGTVPVPRGRLDAYDQPARAVDAEGFAAAAQRHPGGVFGGAGQRAWQLPEPSPVGQRRQPCRRAVQRARGVRAVGAVVRLVEADGRRLAGRARFSSAADAFGTRWPAITATAWAAPARTTTSASTTRRGGGCRTPKSSWSTTPCSSPIWRCGARTSASCRSTTS